MSQPTLSECYTRTREILGDIEGGGQIYTNTVLLGHIQSSVRELFRSMRRYAVTKVVREVYYILPANTSVLVPSTAGITDLAQPILIGERGGLTTSVVFGASQVATGLSITATAHLFVMGDVVTLNLLGGLKGAEGAFGVTVVNANTFIANGVIVTGTYTSGGVAARSDNYFYEVTIGTMIPVVRRSSDNDRIVNVAWREGKLWFPVCDEDRQIQISYYSSADVPVGINDLITVDDSLDFIATYAASIAALANGADTLGGTLRVSAAGPRFDEGITGGQLFALMQSGVRELQNRPPEDRSRLAYSPVIPHFGY